MRKIQRIPRPAKVRVRVKVVLSAGLLVGVPVCLGAAPRVDRRDAFAGAVVGLAAALAVGGGCSTVR